jgi:site-specific DNA-cytosine methylase
MPVPVPYVDVLCGGFPCQDISLAGAGAGIDEGTRSGLWYEFARLIRDIRPRYVVVENVSALLARGLDIVLGDLAACGYDAEWDCIPASAVGAPHRRDRVWIVAYPQRDAVRVEPGRGGGQGGAGQALVAVDGPAGGLADPDEQGLEVGERIGGDAREERATVERGRQALGDSDAVRRDGRPGQQWPASGGENLRTQVGGQLNPTWVEWLMGFPTGWTADC